MEFHSNYTKLRRRNRRSRGFRLSSGRLCVIRLRLRLLTAFELLYQYLRRIKKRFTRRKRGEDSMGASRRPDSRLRACRRSNSFYAEAIAECLEFIRKTSSSVDDASKMVVGGGKVEEDGSSRGR
ncbi:hypothetical protein KFK09_016571 [Dendrobium nobile]|uniref:Uncharacterized protein n=1 Tax=Dendrobium nobile TaxID=94219 RepID=A0A8T3AYG0_DENNO|nr:hypothetical protein KFK09_016571 [Dendrobium nobile]